MQDQVPGLESPHYACLYAWLSGSFARELSDVQIAELTSPELVAWLAVLEPIPALTTPVVQFKQAVQTLQQRPDARLELGRLCRAVLNDGEIRCVTLFLLLSVGIFAF